MRRKLISDNRRESLLVQEDKGQFTLTHHTLGCFPDLQSYRVMPLTLKQALELADFILHRPHCQPAPTVRTRRGERAMTDKLELEVSLIVAAQRAKLAREDLERELGVRDVEDVEEDFGPGYVDRL